MRTMVCVGLLAAALMVGVVSGTTSRYVGVGSSEMFMVPMRDGVKLHTLVDFPFWGGARGAPPNTTRAACFIGSPYGEGKTELISDVCLLFGSVGIRQDMRGTHKSEGKFTIWHSAANDSYDTMQWISQQSWSNGQVFGLGASADGLAAFAEAKLQPPWLKGQWLIFASSLGYPILFDGGMYRQALTEMWMKATIQDESARCIAEIMANEAPGAWWDALNLTSDYGKVKWPARMWSGWYDLFLVGNIDAFNGYQKLADPSVRGKTQLTIDPLGHCQEAATYFPKNLILGRVLLPIAQALEFIGGLKPSQNTSALTFYVMGPNHDGSFGNYWTSLADWPVFQHVAFYFNKDGTLSPNAYQTATDRTSFLFDPKNPVPTIGGNNLALPCGPLDQQKIEQPFRADVLTFTSDALTSPSALTGPITAVLYVSSNCTDTDFTVKLTDVYPSGESRLIQDGGVRMRWRGLPQGATKPELMIPGTVYRVDVSLWNTSYVFNPSHRIRVSISSSNAPRLSVNPNNGLSLSQNGTGPIYVASNTIYQNQQYPSRIFLPIVPLSALPETKIMVPRLNQLLGGASAKNLWSIAAREAEKLGMSSEEFEHEFAELLA